MAEPEPLPPFSVPRNLRAQRYVEPISVPAQMLDRRKVSKVLTLAANLSGALSESFSAAVDKFVKAPLLAAPALEEDFLVDSSARSGESIWSDPLILALVAAATVLLISWRISLRKGPD